MKFVLPRSAFYQTVFFSPRCMEKKKKREGKKEREKTSKLTLTMRDGWCKKYALEYEVKSGKKANRLFAWILSFSLASFHFSLSLFFHPARGGVNEYVNFFEKSPISAPQSRKVSILDWHLNVLVCIYKVTLFLYVSLLSLSLFLSDTRSRFVRRFLFTRNRSSVTVVI